MEPAIDRYTTEGEAEEEEEGEEEGAWPPFLDYYLCPQSQRAAAVWGRVGRVHWSPNNVSKGAYRVRSWWGTRDIIIKGQYRHNQLKDVLCEVSKMREPPA